MFSYFLNFARGTHTPKLTINPYNEPNINQMTIPIISHKESTIGIFFNLTVMIIGAVILIARQNPNKTQPNDFVLMPSIIKIAPVDDIQKSIFNQE